MTYSQIREYLAAIPPFIPQKVVDGEVPFHLENIKKLLERLGNPQDKLKMIHIAGTNGKGSTSAFLNQILVESGYKVGIFTSPFVERFTEQMRINCEDITEDAFAKVASVVCEERERMRGEGIALASEFEVLCSIAFLYFLQEKCDIVILETGLGGRLDATNIIKTPELAIITSISKDHTQLLGDTLEKIAMEKVGIVKEKGTVLLYPQQETVEQIFVKTCKQKEAQLHFAVLPKQADGFDLSGQRFCIPASANGVKLQDVEISLLGHYQINNATMAVEAARILQTKGYRISETAIRKGLKATAWIGRFELMQKEPMVVIDGSHNEDGVAMLKESLMRYFPEKKITFVTGVLADKDYDRMMKMLLPLAKEFLTITPPSPRALPAEELAEELQKKGAKATFFKELKEALSAAMSSAYSDDVICVFGSLYFLGEVRAFFLKQN